MRNLGRWGRSPAPGEPANWLLPVANAHPDVLAAADEVTVSNDRFGVALVIERLFAVDPPATVPPVGGQADQASEPDSAVA